MQKKKPQEKKKIVKKQKNQPQKNKAEPELELGLKPANEITEVDDLQFELGRLRTLFEMWDFDLKIDGMNFHLLVDPLNRQVSGGMDE